MAHLVMDTLIAHELELRIPVEAIMERLPEWNATVLTARSRSEYIKGMAAFCGLELLTYEVADVRRLKNGSFVVKVYSDQWVMRQPA
jgi:hypothetical protein